MSRSILFASAALVFAVPAQAQTEWYVSGQGGLVIQSDSRNTGELTGALTTGNGTPAVPNGTVLPAGTDVSWDTDFDNGLALSGEVGARFGAVRAGVEFAYTRAGVSTHQGVTVGGTNIDGVDAAVLTGSATQLGATVGQVVADGRGHIRNLSLFLNGYYDLPTGGPVSPYLGAGVGVTASKIRYNPSGVGIIDDSATRFAYQLMAGVTFRLAQSVDLFGQYAYRDGTDPEVDVDLFPARLKVENNQQLVSAGLRFRF